MIKSVRRKVWLYCNICGKKFLLASYHWRVCSVKCRDGLNKIYHSSEFGSWRRPYYANYYREKVRTNPEKMAERRLRAKKYKRLTIT